MKNSKLILITAIMFFASIGFSSTESTKANSELSQDNTVMKIHVLKAQETPGLYEATLQQVSSSFLLLKTNTLYKFRVKWHGNEYVVYGYYLEWAYFFTEEAPIGGH